MLILGIDVGTTAIKARIYDEKATLFASAENEYGTLRNRDFQEIDIAQLTDALFLTISEATSKVPGLVQGICVSSLGESFVPVGHDGRILENSMLNCDHRGEEQCEELTHSISQSEIIRICGTAPHSMYSLPKMMYIKKHQPEIYEKTYKFLCIGDYVYFLLSGRFVTDYSLASRTMAFDIRELTWSKPILKAAEIEIGKLPEPLPTGSIIGDATVAMKEMLHLAPNCQIITGGHDQVCAALGAGVCHVGQCNDGTGTVECMTILFDKIPTNESFYENGYCAVPYAIPGTYVTYAFNLTSGAMLKWFRDKIAADKNSALKANNIDFYDYACSQDVKLPTHLLVLPYFAGSATPYMDSDATGAIIGLNLETTSFDLFHALMEGTTYEMRLNIEKLHDCGVEIKELTATGGGAKSQKWMQIKAGIINKPIFPLRAKEGGIIGCIILALKAMGMVSDIPEAISRFVTRDEKVPSPSPAIIEAYTHEFARYRNFYPSIKLIEK